VKRLLLALALFTTAAYAGWPYLYLYRLDRAVATGRPAALSGLVGLDALRTAYRKRIDAGVEQALGEASNPVAKWLREGARSLGAHAVEQLIDLDWALAKLRPPTSTPDGDGAEPGAGRGLLSNTTYAFFESWNRFDVEIRYPQRPALRIVLALSGWRWQVVEIV